MHFSNFHSDLIRGFDPRLPNPGRTVSCNYVNVNGLVRNPTRGKRLTGQSGFFRIALILLVRKLNGEHNIRVPKPPVFSPFAILFRHPHKTEASLVQLVGTDPAEEDRNKVYLWPDAIGGWEERQPCALSQEGLQRLHNNCGKTSGWPGAIPVPQEKRPQGRPPSPNKEKVEREVIRVSLERELVLKAMQCAAKEQKMLPQWIKGLIEDALAHRPG